MNIVVVDDEPLARARLNRLVEQIPEWTVVGEGANGREALEQVERFSPDVILLDIRMPGIDGLEAARHLSNYDSPPAIIFTTAYGDHALEAFDAHALAYLLKPIQKEKLEEALGRAKQVSQAQLSAVNDESGLGAARTHIAAKQRGGMHLVSVDDILYFQADQKYVTVRHTEGEVLIEDSLKALEEEFGDLFLRIHRKTLVSRKHVRGINRTPTGQFQIVLKECEETPEISRRHVSEIKSALTHI